ncbi:MAG: hypothetical protein ACLFUJ_14820 [Phycisphaerae bacterium]
MKRRLMVLALACLAFQAVLGCSQERIELKVHDQAVNHVDDKLFGHFLERASWGEPGYDAARVGDSGRLDPRVVAILADWDVPLIRWPGGGDIRRIDWRDMIDNVPGREGPRPLFDISPKHPPLSNLFGVDEFLTLCDQLGAEPLLPVNFGAALSKEMPLEEAARLAAGLVAYCNSPVGADLPEGMVDWPAIRKKNGRAEPYRVRYFQIGNEIWIYARETFEKIGLGAEAADNQARARWYLKCFNAFADAMKAVDPHIELITELNHTGDRLGPEMNRLVLMDPSMQKADWFVRHSYAPWAIKRISDDGREVDPRSLDDEQIWNAWVSLPRIDPESGLADFGWSDELRGLGRRVAVTEWNWNGWWGLGRENRPDFDSDLAKGVGAAGWLHAMMRLGDVIGMGCQSMTVGSSWGITGIRVDPSGKVAPYPLPTGQVTGLYSRYHGNVRLRTTTANVPHFAQPFQMAGIAPAEKVLALDIVATSGPEAIYLHVINRSFSRDLEVQVDLSDFEDVAGPAVLHSLTGRLENQPGPGQDLPVASVDDTLVEFSGGELTVRFPKRSVSVLEIPRRAAE